MGDLIGKSVKRVEKKIIVYLKEKVNTPMTLICQTKPSCSLCAKSACTRKFSQR